jgi:hypothetical protein
MDEERGGEQCLEEPGLAGVVVVHRRDMNYIAVLTSCVIAVIMSRLERDLTKFF